MDHRFNLIVVTGVAAVLAGCDSPSERESAMARTFVIEQSKQNRRISAAQGAVAQGSQQLVEADATARRDFAVLQQQLHQDQVVISSQRDALEAERRQLALERRTDSLLSASVSTIGVLLACLAPLTLAGLALWSLHRGPTDQEVGEVLVEELAEMLANSRSRAPAIPAEPENSLSSLRKLSGQNPPRR